MKRKYLILITALLIIGSVIVSCTRSASGGPTDTTVEDTALPDPVSTQSQLMKDIIAGTQTAMAAPVEKTKKPADKPNDDTTDADPGEPTPKPTKKPTKEVMLPTATAGPPPVIELNYNPKQCAPGLFICEVMHTKDQTVTIQATHPWLLNGMPLTFKMGPEGSYDFENYPVVGTAKYEPDASIGFGFQVTLTIPDSLRGTEVIVVLLETNHPEYHGSELFDNK